jgi:hypothetical protein
MTLPGPQGHAAAVDGLAAGKISRGSIVVEAGIERLPRQRSPTSVDLRSTFSTGVEEARSVSVLLERGRLYDANRRKSK